MVDIDSLKPINRKILIKCVEEKQKGKIIIPKTIRKPAWKGEVIAIADVKKEDDPIELKKGDIIIFEKYTGIQVITSEDREHEYFLLNEENIMAVIEE